MGLSIEEIVQNPTSEQREWIETTHSLMNELEPSRRVTRTRVLSTLMSSLVPGYFVLSKDDERIRRDFAAVLELLRSEELVRYKITKNTYLTPGIDSLAGEIVQMADIGQAALMLAEAAYLSPLKQHLISAQTDSYGLPIIAAMGYVMFAVAKSVGQFCKMSLLKSNLKEDYERLLKVSPSLKIPS